MTDWLRILERTVGLGVIVGGAYVLAITAPNILSRRLVMEELDEYVFEGTTLVNLSGIREIHLRDGKAYLQSHDLNKNGRFDWGEIDARLRVSDPERKSVLWAYANPESLETVKNNILYGSHPIATGSGESSAWGRT